jgi:hypothetical protein
MAGTIAFSKKMEKGKLSGKGNAAEFHLQGRTFSGAG